MREEFNSEVRKLFHMTFISTFSAMSILLIVITYISDWELWMIPVSVVAILSCWIFHIFDFFSDRVRIYIYLIYTTLELMFYGTHFDSLTDIPVILCLIIICMSSYGDVKLLYFAETSFVFSILYHVFITKELNSSCSQLVIARIVLGVMCLGCATILSRFFITVKQNERNDIKELEHFLNNV